MVSCWVEGDVYRAAVHPTAALDGLPRLVTPCVPTPLDWPSDRPSDWRGDRSPRLATYSRVSMRSSTSIPSNWMCGSTDRLQSYQPIIPSRSVTSTLAALNG